MSSEQCKLLSPVSSILNYFRYVKAVLTFTDHPCISFKRKIFPKLHLDSGDSSRLRTFFNKHKGKRCFVLGNGPSLSKLDLNFLKDEILIGSNGVYKLFNQFDFCPEYLVFQDALTIAKKAEEINQIKGITKLVALHASHLLKRDSDTMFFYLANHLGWHEISPDNESIIEENLPLFSNNFSAYASNLGNVTHTALQLAYYLGCDPVYIIGCDHSHGSLCKHYRPGHVKINEGNFHHFQNNHFTKNYYKIGDYIGVPYYKFETLGYSTANEFFNKQGRVLLNAGTNSQIDSIPKTDYMKLFDIS